MEAELRSTLKTGCAPAESSLRMRDDWRDVVFSVPQARTALKYIAHVAGDAVRAFNTVRRCRDLLDEGVSRETRALLCEQRDLAIQRLDQAIDECNQVGVHLFDLESGSLAFPSEIDGRPACLIWRCDWPIEPAWTELASARG
jgi:hypothetical protein